MDKDCRLMWASCRDGEGQGCERRVCSMGRVTRDQLLLVRLHRLWNKARGLWRGEKVLQGAERGVI